MEMPKEIDDLFAQVGRMTDNDLRHLRGIWDQVDPNARRDVWGEAKRNLVSMHKWDIYERAQEEVNAWVRDYASGRSGTYPDFSDATRLRLQVRIDATPPILDAVVALLCGHRLSSDDVDILMGPMLAMTDGEPSQT